MLNSELALLGVGVSEIGVGVVQKLEVCLGFNCCDIIQD